MPFAKFHVASIMRRLPERCVALVLAAGKGTRLGFNVPKSLVDINGRPVLSYIFSALLEAGVTEVTIVTGYESQMIAAYCANHSMLGTVSFVNNRRYASTGTAYSMLLGLRGLVGRSVIVIEGDVVLDSNIIRGLIGEGVRNVAAIAEFTVKHSGSRVSLDERRIVQWWHESDASPPPSAVWKTVNVQCWTCGAVKSELIPRLEALVRTSINAPAEFAFAELVSTGFLIESYDVGVARWFEVDTPADLEIAREIFSEE